MAKHNFDQLSNKIIGAAIQVHRELGPGFIENIYEEALKVEFSRRKINFRAFVITKYKGRKKWEKYLRPWKSTKKNEGQPGILKN